MDGLILCSVARDDTFVYELKKQNIPFVLALRSVRQSASRPRLDYVVVDNRHGGFLAVDHLLTMGHQNIAMITGTDEHFD